MYGVIEALTEIEKALTGTNVQYIEMDNLADLMVFERRSAYAVIEFLHDCERIDYIQRDRLCEIANNCESPDD